MYSQFVILLGLTALLPQQAPGKDGDKSKAANPAPTAVALTVEQAVAVSQPSDLQFSPDGRRLAFSVLRPAKGTARGQEIWMLDSGASAHRLWRFTHSSKADRMPRWSPDGTQVAFISDRDERAQIYLIPADGGEAEQLTGGKNAVGSIEWSPDGKRIAFLAPEPKSEAEEKKEKDKDDARVVDVDDKPARLWIIEIATKKIHKLTPSDWQIGEVRWAQKDNRLVVTATEHPDGLVPRTRVFLVSPDDGAMKVIHALPGRVSDLQLSPDGLNLSVIAARGDGPSPHDLFIAPVGPGSPRNLTATLDRPIEGHAWRKDGPLRIVVQEGFRSRSADLPLDEKPRFLPDEDVNPVGRIALSENGTAAFVGQTATDPPDVWLAPAHGRAQRVTKFNDALRKLGLIKPELVRYASFDKTEIEAALYRPKHTADDRPSPLVVLVHGGPTARWSDSYNAWAQLLSARGFAVLCPNIRGSVGYGWDFLVMNRSDWGGGDFKDVMAGVDHLIAVGIADPERLGIAGWSYGGYMAAWAITQTPRFRAAVVGAGMSDLASEFGTEMTATAQYDRWFYGVPYERPEGFAKSSPITHIKNAKTPTLILHGENDPIDPIGQAQQLHRGLKNYGVTCEFVLYPRAGHGLQEEKHVLDYHKRICRWFEAHLK